MARPRSPNRDRAKQLWLESGKKRPLKDIATELQVSEEQVRKWKNQDKWDKVTLPNAKSNVTNSKPRKKEVVANVIDQVMSNPELNDKQQLFCIFLAFGDSATSAYQKAYECSYQTAMAAGSRLLRNVKIKEEVARLKKERFETQLFGEHDIFQWYLDVATANITDFVAFGREEIQAMGAFGPIVDKKTGEPVMKEINYVKFKESAEVNGHVIKKVKLGRDGASIELYDAMAAMNWLADHMSMGTNGQQTLVQNIIDAWNKRVARKMTEQKEEGDGADAE